MEHKQILLSALSIGIGLGIGLASASEAVNRWKTAQGMTPEQIELELHSLIVDAKESNITFDHFPYYLNERTRVLLTSAAYVHLNHFNVSKHTRNLSPATRAILLSGPAELYMRILARALAHRFQSKLLLLDLSDFSIKSQIKYGISRESFSERSIPEAILDRVSSFIGSFSILPTNENLTDMNCINSHSCYLNSAPLKRISFDEKVFIESLYKVLTSVSGTSSIILYVRDVDRLFLSSPKFYKLFYNLLKKLSGSIVVLGSRMLDPDNKNVEKDKKLNLLFPYNIEILPPENEKHLVTWKAQLEEDIQTVQFHDNKNHIVQVLAENDLECDDLTSICQADTVILSNYIDEIVVSAVSYHLMNIRTPEYRNGKLIISSNSLSHGLSIFQEAKNANATENSSDSVEKDGENQSASVEKDGENPSASVEKDGENPSASESSEVCDDDIEKRIKEEVIPEHKIAVTFSDIGALDEIKESLQELVMLPLRRPELFKGGLLKPCRGILLFGPPGTGKTMLAKAIAKEAGASFINVSMSTISSKWVGEDEKNVRALFKLAAKVAPTVIFVDEVDSMLGKRSRSGEREDMRKIKNEFMTLWDGLLTKPGEQILVLGATNRPFDLDEAIIRRFERRIMVGLPCAESREKILRTLLAKEIIENVDFKELTRMTEGYSGSDLKNLCVTAAYRPVRDLIQQEKQKDMEKKESFEDATRTNEATNEERVISLRPLNMEDMKQARNQVAASFSGEGPVMSELKQWNELYGEGGSRKKEQLSYFL